MAHCAEDGREVGGQGSIPLASHIFFPLLTILNGIARGRGKPVQDLPFLRSRFCMAHCAEDGREVGGQGSIPLASHIFFPLLTILNGIARGRGKPVQDLPASVERQLS